MELNNSRSVYLSISFIVLSVFLFVLMWTGVVRAETRHMHGRACDTPEGLTAFFKTYEVIVEAGGTWEDVISASLRSGRRCGRLDGDAEFGKIVSRFKCVHGAIIGVREIITPMKTYYTWETLKKAPQGQET